MEYAIAFAQSVREQLPSLTARERTRVLDAIEEQLSHQSLVETKHRKAPRPTPIAPWELRAGYFRVFYDVAAGRTEERRQALYRRPGDQIMKTIELSDASKPLSDYAEELDDDILVVTSRKKPVAALVPRKHVDREALALSTNPEFRAIIEAAMEEFRVGKTLSLEEMKREVLK